MATVSTLSHVTPDEVFAVLANGWRYAEWVVGTKRIRAVDENWPEQGSRFYHAIGVGPVTIRDSSECLEVEPGRRIVLDVRAWPAGRGQVTIELEAVPNGCRITIDEFPTGGPAQALDSPPLHASIHLRNTESLRRLRRAAEEARLAESE